MIPFQTDIKTVLPQLSQLRTIEEINTFLVDNKYLLSPHDYLSLFIGNEDDVIKRYTLATKLLLQTASPIKDQNGWYDLSILDNIYLFSGRTLSQLGIDYAVHDRERFKSNILDRNNINYIKVDSCILDGMLNKQGENKITNNILLRYSLHNHKKNTPVLLFTYNSYIKVLTHLNTQNTNVKILKNYLLQISNILLVNYNDLYRRLYEGNITIIKQELLPDCSQNNIDNLLQIEKEHKNTTNKKPNILNNLNRLISDINIKNMNQEDIKQAIVLTDIIKMKLLATQEDYDF